MLTNGAPLLAFVTGFVRQLPVIAVTVAGLVMALSRRDRHPKASSLAAAGCGILLGVALVVPVWYALLPRLLGGSAGMARLGGIYALSSVLVGLVDAAGIGLVVLAVFSDRGAGEPSS